MYIDWVLRDDCMAIDENREKIQCGCGACYICEFEELCKDERIGFKETSLFEYLDIVVAEFPVCSGSFMDL